MKRLLPALALLLLTFTSCNNLRNELENFVHKYNNSANVFSESNILKTKAEIKGDDHIRILLQVDVDDTNFQREYFSNLVPFLAANMVSDKSVNVLLKKGVTFELEITAANKALLTKTVLDASRIAKLIGEMEQKVYVNPVNPNGIIPGNRVIPQELRKSVNIIKRGLPIHDKQAGTTITDIDINGELELEYHVTVDEPTASRIANDQAMELIKKEVIRSADLNAIYQTVGIYGIRSLRYSYFNPKLEKIGSFPVTYNELWKRKENNYAPPAPQ